MSSEDKPETVTEDPPRIPTYHAAGGVLKPFPHPVCCEGCYRAKLCCMCGERSTMWTGRCTSGRCPKCCTGYARREGACGHTSGS